MPTPTAAAAPVRLTSLSTCAGCAAKVSQPELAKLLRALPHAADANLLVGSATGDDAGVYRIGPNLALVQTVDFFTPVVDDAADFGAIAATNAISDVYAMGGRPVTAMAIVGVPTDRLPPAVINAILKGGAAVAKRAGVSLLGGHTIKLPEPVYGLAVTGLVDPRRVMTNAGARPGDLLVLTKPLGTGIVTTGIKRGLASAKVAAAAVLLTLRDPRALLASQIQLERTRRQRRFSVYLVVRHWLKTAQLVLQYQPDSETNRALEIIEYQRLVTEPAATLRRVCAFLGIVEMPCAYTPTKIGYPWGGNSSAGETFHAISRAPAERWRTVLTRDEIGWIEWHCRADMERLGYAPLLSRRQLRHWAAPLRGETPREYLKSRFYSVFGRRGDGKVIAAMVTHGAGSRV